MNVFLKLFFFVVFFFQNLQADVITHNFKKYPKTKTDFKLQELIKGFNYPWGITFIDKENLIITEKNGGILKVNIVTKEVIKIKHQIKSIPFDGSDQGGLLDVLYNDGYLYFSYSHAHEEINKKKYSSTAIARGKLIKDEIKDFEILLIGKPMLTRNIHWGSRIIIHNNHLYAGFGERGLGMIAQDPSKHPGSIIRINIDGSIPKDNPKFIDKKDWLPEIFQIGVRNPQGLTLNPFDQKIYASNHGARGGDWFGEIKKGENYGWKVLGWGGTNYSGTKIGPKWLPGYTKAIKYWVPSIATSAITIYKGEEFKEWNGHALITSLKDMSLRKLDFSNLENVKEEVIFKREIGRIRDIQVHPVSGKIFFLSQDALWLMQKN